MDIFPLTACHAGYRNYNRNQSLLAVLMGKSAVRSQARAILLFNGIKYTVTAQSTDIYAHFSDLFVKYLTFIYWERGKQYVLWTLDRRFVLAFVKGQYQTQPSLLQGECFHTISVRLHEEKSNVYLSSKFQQNFIFPILSCEPLI